MFASFFIIFSYRLQSGKGRPGLETIFRGKTRPWEGPPVPAVEDVAVEVNVSVVRIVGILRHPSFLLRFSPVRWTGDKKRATLVLLKEMGLLFLPICRSNTENTLLGKCIAPVPDNEIIN